MVRIITISRYLKDKENFINLLGAQQDVKDGVNSCYSLITGVRKNVCL